MPGGKGTIPRGGRVEEVCCAGVCWIRVKCGISFQGRDSEQGGTTPTQFGPWSVFSSPELECTDHRPSRAAPDRQHWGKEERGRDEGSDEDSRDLQVNSLIFMCARDEL